MKKIDATVLKETGYIALVTGILSVLLQAVLLIIGRWEITHLLGNIWGALGAVSNFLLMGITVQHAVLKEEKEAKKLIQFSQSARMFFLITIAGIGWFVPFFHILSVVIPLLFPRIAIALRPLLMKE